MNWPVFFGEEKKTKPWHYKVNRFIMVILLLNALVVFLSTFPYIKDKIGVILHVVDVVTSLFFVVEVSLRIWVADLFSSRFKGVLGRVRYCLTPTGLIDFLATYPPIICMPFGVSGALLKALRVVRLVRLFRFMRAFRLLGKALNNKKQEMLLSLGFLAVVTFMLSLVLYYIEQEEVNTHYTDGLDSVKWAFLQYIGDPGGFGGDGPATIGGRIIASVIGVIGIAVFAVLPALQVQALQKRWRLTARTILPAKEVGPQKAEESGKPLKGIPSDYKVTVAEVERYLNKWQGLTNYVDQEEALDMLFNNLCPHSTCIKDVLLKISVLNDFYSTNIYDVHSVAVHYLNDVKDVDRRIQQADATLEDQLATVPMGKDGKKIRHYSFVFFM